MPVAPTSPWDLLDLLRKSNVLSPDRLASIDAAALPPQPRKAAAVLIQKGLITRFQAEQLLAGRHKGFRLGPYAVLDQLGRGGMGAVYLAEHIELHRKVAIKVLISGKEEDQKLAVERFLREARAAAALDHPNIVRIFDVCRHGDVPYLVMEYVEGETLQQILDRDGTVPYTTACEYVAQAAAGLQHAHEKGFVHRDIKPGNVIREKSGTVKILDMGLARLSGSEHDKITEELDAGAVVGTADFIAPEQALNNTPIDIRADIYSLGATFFAMILGRPPFEGNTPQKLLHHQMTTAPSMAAFDPTLPKGLVGVVAKMLAKKPDDRFQTPAEVIGGLAPWLANSSRIMAGLSRTNLAVGAELHATLNEIARRSSTRLGVTQKERGPDDPHDSAEVDPGSPMRETGEIATADTTREPLKPGKKEAAAQPAKKQPFALYAVGVVLIVAAGVTAAVALGGKSDDTKPTPTPPPDTAKDATPPVVPPPEPKDDPKPQPAPKADAGPKALPPQAAYKLDLSAQKPFRTRGTYESTGKQIGRDVRFVPASKSGDGDFPAGWTGTPYSAGSEAEFWSEPRSGRPVLGLRNLQKGPAMLLSPDLTIRGGLCHVRFEYMSEGTGDRVGVVKFKSIEKPRPAGLIELYHLPGTNGTWRTVEGNVDLRGLDRGFFEVHNLDADPTRALYLGAFEVSDFRSVQEPVLYQLNLSGQKPFVIRSGLEMNAATPPQKVAKVISRDGPGEPPPGWNARCWGTDTQMEYFADDARGGSAVGIRNVRGPGSAMLFSPRFDCPSSVCRLRLEYATAVKDKKFTIKFKTNDSRAAWNVAAPATTGDVWRTEDVIVDLQKATGGYFEFHNADDSPDAAVRFRNVTVTLLPAGTAVAALPGTTPAGPDYTRWTVKAQVYRFDAAAVAPFRVTKEGGKVTAGTGEKLPTGISLRCWKATASGEFRRDADVAGSPALGLTNLSDEMSAQFAFELEKDLKLALKPGSVYRVKVSYLTKNEATGNLVVQSQDYKGVTSAKMTNTAGQWKDLTAHFERKDGVPVRLTIDNSTVGEGNTLYVRSVELVEVEQPPTK